MEHLKIFLIFLASSNKSIQNEAFRNEIRPQIQRFRERFEDVSACPLCKMKKKNGVSC